jgi:hypothetical protein
LVANELPHEHVTLISEYCGCVSFFILFYKLCICFYREAC